MTQTERWNAVANRDAAFDGHFVFAVQTTGIYCRPSCPARRPLRENTRFFTTCDAAEQAGFRPCRRCHPRHSSTSTPVNRRAFRKLTGLTPRQVQESRRWESLKAKLRSGEDVTSALYDAGFGASSRVYEKATASLGMTPGQYRKAGEGVAIRFAVARCSLGYLLLAATTNGVCAVRLGDDPVALESELRAEFAKAAIQPDPQGMAEWLRVVVDSWGSSKQACGLPLDVRGTFFQMRVWQLLRRIPRGEVRSYRQVAEALGQPKAVRAVAQACAANPAALLVPCHRVVRADGALAGYRWSVERKAALLDLESQ
jgi:AraC family transcriptional regulator, regulatory protein of adaptative response / methylated-DNA-[protein]-cysteine methyltransferase